MLKFIFRKTLYKNIDSKSINRFFQLKYKEVLVEILCNMVWVIVFVFPLIPVLLADLCEKGEFSTFTQAIVMAFLIIYVVAVFIFVKLFHEQMYVFSFLVSKKVFFKKYTMKGKAISKNDFATIKEANAKLYKAISAGKCTGYCYYVCFEILKALEKGYIQFLACEKFNFEKEDDDDDGKNYTMHVIYVNNDWIFDTFSQRQYSIEEYYRIQNVKLYKNFSFSDIEGKSYEVFRDENEPDLAEWCNNNDCSQFWKE